MPLGNERYSVQNPLLKYASEINWTYITQDDALILRGGETGFVFKETFISQIQKLNDFITQPLAEDLIRKIEVIIKQRGLPLNRDKYGRFFLL